MAISLSDVPHLIEGYTTTKRIGAGGYGEVWEVIAPGGLKKAIKLVYGYVNEERAARELKALRHIIHVRHPYVLSLERIEVINDRLLVVTELAERSLIDRFQECRAQGLRGIPRAELIKYLQDAAEALDYLSDTHGLQHLDIKPENLLLLCGHIKVADFGLVKDVVDPSNSCMGGLTPRYAAPETFAGVPSQQSDQYSLAIVYQQLLTGAVPFPGRTTAQLATQHVNSEPQLLALPEIDRATVRRALAKSPEHRFRSCCDFVETLANAGRAPSASTPDTTTKQPDSHGSVERKDNDGDTKTSESVATEVVAPTALGEDSSAQVITETLHGIVPGQCLLIDPETPSQDGAASCAPTVRVLNTTSMLPPIVADSQPWTATPTLVVGLGGTGARVLAWLRRQIAKGAQSLSMSPKTFEMLLLDTDHDAMDAVQNIDCTTEASGADALMLPLRSPDAYRGGSQHYLRWISRRWLYNIPHSLKTEGFRPLGRLAYVDHEELVRESLRERLQRVVAGIAGDNHHSGPISPRVFIVGSVSGGTAGGMMLDVAQEVRVILGELGVESPEVVGLLAHSTNKRRKDGDLALANAHATLNELRHMACHFPNEKEGSINCGPFARTYFVNLGQQLGENQFNKKLQAVAAFVYFNTTTRLGDVLARCDDGNPGDVDGCDLMLRSFALSSVTARNPHDSEQLLSRLDSLNSAMAQSLMECGYLWRNIVVAPEKSISELAQSSISSQATVIGSEHNHTFICSQAERLSLAHVAHQLTRGRPDIVAAAGRLYTRKDIQWSDLPVPQPA